MSPDPEAPRNNCAFCGRERVPKDDNHAPECPYWDFFGDAEDDNQQTKENNA